MCHSRVQRVASSSRRLVSPSREPLLGVTSRFEPLRTSRVSYRPCTLQCLPAAQVLTHKLLRPKKVRVSDLPISLPPEDAAFAAFFAPRFCLLSNVA